MNPSQPEPVAGATSEIDAQLAEGAHPTHIESDEWEREQRRTAQTGEQTPESAEVKACPFCQQVPKELGDGYVAHHLKDANCIIATYAFRLDRWNTRAESSSLASLQQENERLREELRNEIADKRTVEGFYKSAGDEAEQLRAEVERLTREREEMENYATALAGIDADRDRLAEENATLQRERDEARAEREVKVRELQRVWFDTPWLHRNERHNPECACIACNMHEAYGVQLDSLRAQLAEREEDRWQPIETAPFVEGDLGPSVLLRGSFIVAGGLSPESIEKGYSTGVLGKFAVNALPFRATGWMRLPAIRSARGAAGQAAAEVKP